MFTQALTEPKHTPGPWRANRGHIEAPTPPGSDCALDTIELAQVWSGGSGIEQAHANELLMAAAPDMLRVLRTTLGNIMSLGPARAIDSVPMEYRIWAQVVADVIAQATGGEATPLPEQPPKLLPDALPRRLAGRIVDEVFGGAIEDASVIEDIYRVIAQYANARWSAE